MRESWRIKRNKGKEREREREGEILSDIPFHRLFYFSATVWERDTIIYSYFVVFFFVVRMYVCAKCIRSSAISPSLSLFLSIRFFSWLSSAMKLVSVLLLQLLYVCGGCCCWCCLERWSKEEGRNKKEKKEINRTKEKERKKERGWQKIRGNCTTQYYVGWIRLGLTFIAPSNFASLAFTSLFFRRWLIFFFCSKGNCESMLTFIRLCIESFVNFLYEK